MPRDAPQDTHTARLLALKSPDTRPPVRRIEALADCLESDCCSCGCRVMLAATARLWLRRFTYSWRG
jgi:hypothetical protein